MDANSGQSNAPPVSWGKVIDNSRCIGCHACSTACKSENEVPLSVNRTFVKYVDVGIFPQAARNFQVTRCNQCANPPCVTACPTAAMFRRPDGIVDFDKSVCVGCKACIAACPYDAIFINPEDHSAEKCNFCAHRIDVGLEPACVVVCPTEAIAIGDLNDPASRVAQIVNRGRVQVRRPEKDTQPKLFYINGHEAALDPLGARQPDGGQYIWSQQVDGVTRPTRAQSPSNSSAAAIVSYDVPHHAPWDWRVSLYTWTKSIATGAYLVPLLLVLTGVLGSSASLWRWSAAMVAGTLLAATGVVLIADLAHPERFYLILLRPQWRSWLTRGAFIISGFGTVLAVHFAISLFGTGGPQLWLAILGVPLAILTSVYTAYLFAQAKARDLWQNPLLPLHLLVQALVAGTAVYLLASPHILGDAFEPLAWGLAAAAGVHVVLIASEAMMAHPTAHARLAAHELVAGKFRGYYWVGMVLVALAGALAACAHFEGNLCVPAGALALIGLLAYEHAYVQAGQTVPLA